jgi:beta-galactosidase
MLSHTMGKWESPYACEGAVVYRISAPQADHYFFINDDEAKSVLLDTKRYIYVSASDPVTEESIGLGEPIQLDAYSGRWLRFQK